MNQLKRLLKGEIQYIEPTIVETLKQYESVKIGSVVYLTNEIINKIEQQVCPHCIVYKREIQSLKYQLDKFNAPDVPPMKLLLEKYIHENFVKIKEREYSRKQLFTEVNCYLRELNLQIVENTDTMWRYLIETIIGDSNRNYRKLKIRRKQVNEWFQYTTH